MAIYFCSSRTREKYQSRSRCGEKCTSMYCFNENPLKGHVARLQQEERGTLVNSKETNNVLPITLSPRVPAPSVGGLTEGRLMAKGAKRRIVSEEDKENDVPTIAGSLKRKATIGKKRGAVQQAFPDIPEEANNDLGEVRPRRMAPPVRKPSWDYYTNSINQIRSYCISSYIISMSRLNVPQNKLPPKQSHQEQNGHYEEQRL